MGMKKGQKQYGKAFTEQIFKLHYDEGKTLRETAETLGVNRKVIVDAITRENTRRKKLEAGEPPTPNRGRPRTKPMTTMEELQKRNKELEMENELLKKYHEELRR